MTIYTPTIAKITEWGSYHNFPLTVTFVASLPDTQWFALTGEPGDPTHPSTSTQTSSAVMNYRTQYLANGSGGYAKQYDDSDEAYAEWRRSRAWMPAEIASPFARLSVTENKPTAVSQGDFEAVVEWTRNGVDDIPRCQDPVDATVRLLSRYGLTTIRGLEAGVKDFVGLAMRIKRRNILDAETEPVVETETRVLTVTVVDGKIDMIPSETEALLIASGWATPGDKAALEERVTAQSQRAILTVQKHHEDIATIGTRLMEEAERRDWCSEYDDIVDSLNDTLNVPLETRNKTYEVTVIGYVRIPFSRTVTIEDVSDEDTAQDQARDEIVGASARDLQYDIDWYLAEIDEESVETEIAD